MYENRIVNAMTSTFEMRTELHTRFDALVLNLSSAQDCEVGRFRIMNTRACSADGFSFDADVMDLSGTIFQAQVRVALSAHENLLGDKVDISVIGPKINQSFTDMTFSINSELSQ